MPDAYGGNHVVYFEIYTILNYLLYLGTPCDTEIRLFSHSGRRQLKEFVLLLICLVSGRNTVHLKEKIINIFLVIVMICTGL